MRYINLRFTYLLTLHVAASGQTWAEMKRLWIQGVKTYIADMWNIVESATASLYITAFTVKFVSYFLVRLFSI